MIISALNYPKLHLLFWTAAIVSITAKILNLPLIDHIEIPILTLSLLIIYYLNNGQNNAFYFSFCFCLLGDLMVIIPDINYFFSGLMSYWGACLLFYLVVAKETDVSIKTFIQKPLLLLPYGLYGIYFIAINVFLYPQMKELFIPILIYALTLSYVCAHSIVSYLSNKDTSNLYLCVGLILLSIAASFIGLNKFYFSLYYLRAFEILFYAPSLYFIFLYFNYKNRYEN